MRWLLVACLVCLPMQASAFTLGLEGQLYSDDGAIDGFKRIGPQSPRDEDRDFVGSSFATIALYTWFDADDRLRYGAGVRFFGNYGLFDDVPPDQIDEDRVPYEMGTMFQLYGHLEWILPLATELKLDFLVGTQVGIGILFPGTDFGAEIESEQQDGAGVLGLPRLGFMFGPQVGVRYQLIKDTLFARLDFGVRFERYGLFATEQEIEGVAYSKQWTMNVLRYDAGLGIELTF